MWIIVVSTGNSASGNCCYEADKKQRCIVVIGRSQPSIRRRGDGPLHRASGEPKQARATTPSQLNSSLSPLLYILLFTLLGKPAFHLRLTWQNSSFFLFLYRLNLITCNSWSTYVLIVQNYLLFRSLCPKTGHLLFRSMSFLVLIVLRSVVCVPGGRQLVA